MLLPQIVPRDFEIGGHSLSRGSWLIISPFVVHLSLRYSPSPEKFLPERFLMDPGVASPTEAYFPYGESRRFPSTLRAERLARHVRKGYTGA